MRGHLPGPGSCHVTCSGEDNWARGRLQAHALTLPPCLGSGQGSDLTSPAHGFREGAWPGSKGRDLCLHCTLVLGPPGNGFPFLNLTFLLFKMGPTEASSSSDTDSEESIHFVALGCREASGGEK